MPSGSSRTSPPRIKAAERRVDALALRRDGSTFARIGDALGISRQGAHELVTRGLRDLAERDQEAAAELRQVEWRRLELVEAAFWEEALAGNARAAGIVLRCSGQRARLAGLNLVEPLVQIGVTGATTVVAPSETALRLGREPVDADEFERARAAWARRLAIELEEAPPVLALSPPADRET